MPSGVFAERGILRPGQVKVKKMMLEWIMTDAHALAGLLLTFVVMVLCVCTLVASVKSGCL